MFVCGGRSNGRLCSTWLSDAWSLLPGLCSLASHSAAIPLSPLHLLLSLFSFHSSYTYCKGKSKPFVFCIRPAPHSSPPPFLSFSSPLTKSLFRLDTAENHMVCDIIRAGSRERGMVEQGRDWLARSLCSYVRRKALWEAPSGVRAEQVGNFILFFFMSNFNPTWIIRD